MWHRLATRDKEALAISDSLRCMRCPENNSLHEHVVGFVH